jgi:hypothetical protein
LDAAPSFAITEKTVDSLWERHRKLTLAAVTNPLLLADRCHVEAMARAERAFRAAYDRLQPTEVLPTK